MLTIILLILALSLDAFSFGFAQGFKKYKLTLVNCLIMSAISTFLFTVPLYLSQFVFKYFNEQVCNIINGIILILLGLYYLYDFIKSKNYKIEDKNNKIIPLRLKICILSTFPISLDAIFTALLNGYSVTYIISAILIYFLFTFCSLYLTNLIGLKFSKDSYISLSWLSSLIFIIIGSLKCFGI